MSANLQPVRALAPEPGLTRGAYAEIRRAILSGELPQGLLTSVRALSEALGISRTPVREALVDLANDRLVAFERNRGVRICVTQRHDIEEIFELRLLLEVPACARAVRQMSDADIAELGRILKQMRSHLDDEHEFMRHDWHFHRKLLAANGNERLTATVESVRNQTRARGLSTVGRSRPLEAIVREHREIYDAVRRRDADATARAMTEHLTTTRALLLAQADRNHTQPRQDAQEAP